MATFPRSTITALPRRDEQSEFAHGAPVKVVFDAVTDDMTQSKVCPGVISGRREVAPPIVTGKLGSTPRMGTGMGHNVIVSGVNLKIEEKGQGRPVCSSTPARGYRLTGRGSTRWRLIIGSSRHIIRGSAGRRCRIGSGPLMIWPTFILIWRRSFSSKTQCWLEAALAAG